MCRLLELVDLLKGREVRIQTHDFPDADAMGTAMGLSWLLEQYGIQSTLVYCGKLDKLNNRRFKDQIHIPLHPLEELPMVTDETYVVTVDGQKDNSNFTDIPGYEVACIDHHPWVTKYDYMFVDHRICGAASSIVAHYIMELGLVPPAYIATALLCGLKMDTLNFSIGVTKYDIEAFSFLNEYADQTMMRDLMQDVMEIEDLQAYGAAIQDIRIYEDMGFAYIPFECTDGLLATISAFLLNLTSVSVSVVYAERNKGLKFSIRSSHPWLRSGQLVNLSLKGIGNGGGHQSMAGGLIFPERRHLLQPDENGEIRKRFLEMYETLKNEYKKGLAE